MINPIYVIYTCLTGGLFLYVFPEFWLYTILSGRYRAGLKERLGFVPQTLVKELKHRKRIWIHAVSVGELQVAAPIMEAVNAIRSDCAFIISTTTEQGRKVARDMFGANFPLIYAPLDFIGSVYKALNSVRPHVMVFLETEIWPNWVAEANRRGIRIGLINGRISVRSLASYMKFRPFMRMVLKNFDIFSMILDEDARRIRLMGADPAKIEVNGNAKYESLIFRKDPSIPDRMQHILNILPYHKVFIAGSTRSGEEEIILGVYKKILIQFPETILILVPRHVERTPAIESLVRGYGFSCCLRSAIHPPNRVRTEQVVIVDTIGELFDLYSVGTIIFCGASLVPLGGQNPLEAAVWGKPVFYGPSMEDFLDAKQLLEKGGAGIEVRNGDMLAEKALWFLNHPEELKALGCRACNAVSVNKGAAKRHAEAICRLL
nr:3-deoxy-D-manno-octulosonic acid transferase [Desulfobacterales bacterium]